MDQMSEGAAVYVQLLGSPKARIGSKQIPFVPDKRYQLLAFLAYQGDWVSREKLAFLFWPDTLAASGRVNLRGLLHRVRSLPWLIGLETDEHRLRWSVETDVVRVRQAIGEGKVNETLSLYQGPLLLGLDGDGDGEREYGEWLSMEREQFHRRWRDGVLFKIRELEGSGKQAQVAPLLKHLLEQDPLDEEVLQTYMRVAADSGNQGQALGAYQSFVKRLQVELAMEPTTATEQLAKVITGSTTALLSISHTSSKPPPLPSQTPLNPESSPHVRRLNVPLPPRPASSFVGRSLELEQITDLLSQEGCRLLTVTGPGGVGKTRLALQVTQKLARNYPNGVYFMPLDSLTSPDFIPTSLAKALGLELRGQEDALTQVVRFIESKRLLLVLDNYEHLLEGATIASKLLESCPGLTLLVTSREHLNLEEEWLLPIEGLSYPLSGRDLREASTHEAVQLFAERAKRVQPSFTLTDETLPHVGEICRLVRGLPLGLELAAAWLRAMPVAEIAHEIERDYDFLSRSTRNLADRHRSIRAVFEHSWRLLSFTEQIVLRKLSVFRGGFRKEAAVYVTGASYAVLAALVDKSLLRFSPEGRYDRHQLIYQYTQEMLQEHPEEHEETLERHGLYYLHLLQERGGELEGPHIRRAVDFFEEELDNIQLAWGWAAKGVRTKELQRGAWHLVTFLQLRGYFREGIKLLHLAELALDPTNAAHQTSLGYVLLALARLFYRLRESYPQKTKEAAQRATELLRPVGEDWGVAVALLYIGLAQNQEGDSDSGRRYLQESLMLARKNKFVDLIGGVLINLAFIEDKLGNFEEAEHHTREALDIYRDQENPRRTAEALKHLGFIILSTKGPEQALELLHEALKLFKEYGDQMEELHTTVGLTRAYLKLKNYKATVIWAEWGRQQAEKLGIFFFKIMLLLQQARAYAGLDDFTQSARLLEKSSQLVHTIREPNMRKTVILLILLGATHLNIKMKNLEASTLYLGFVLCNLEVLEFYDKQVAKGFLEILQLHLPSDKLTALLEHGKRLSLEEALRKLKTEIASYTPSDS